jgi:NAD(P)-dependent dehydrogenase (short-subunit alcohol dehydrogenase family)
MSAGQRAALIVGASGGIGSALLRQWRDEGRYERLIAACRSPESIRVEGVETVAVDVDIEESIDSFGARVKAALGDCELVTICFCMGLLHSEDCEPERRYASLKGAAFQRLMHVNALGPLLLAQQLLPHLPRQSQSRLLAISARVGSIADNRLGGWISYRCSKAALNQGFKTLAIELQRTHPQCVVTLFHPGTVDTALSTPFQRNVLPENLFEPARAARQLSEVLHARNDPHAHHFVDWAGQPVEY